MANGVKYEMNEYSILLSELHRRKTAYTTLIISLFIGITIPSSDLILLDLSLSVPYLSGFILFLFFTRVWLLSSFKDFSRIKLLINKVVLKRIFKKTSETYMLTDIQNIVTKWTVRGNIREITLKMRDGKRVCVNALRDFEQFEQEIQRYFHSIKSSVIHNAIRRVNLIHKS